VNDPLLRRYPCSVATLTLAVAAFALAWVWHIDVFDLPGLSIIGLERTEVGEVIIVALLTIPAFFVDRVNARQRAHEAQLHAEQLRVLRVTMRTVQDIVNNNLNQLQLLRMEADGHVSDKTLRFFDKTIRDTAAQLTALGNMEVFAEKPMEGGNFLDIDGSPGRP